MVIPFLDKTVKHWKLMKKCFFYLLISLCSITSSYANEVIKCLGKEELRLHQRKDTGPQYKLNQLFINEFASNSDLIIKSKYQQQICEMKYHAPSVTILKLLLTKGKGIFELKSEFGRDGIVGYKIERINDLLSRIAHIFFNYIGSLQARAATHDCLKKHIPEIGYFEVHFKYLEEEYPAKQLLSESEKFEQIFKRLRSLKSIYQVCQREYEVREKERERELNKKK